MENKNNCIPVNNKTTSNSNNITKSKKRLVAFENNKHCTESKNNDANIDEFTPVKNYKIIDNIAKNRFDKFLKSKKAFDNTLVSSNYLKSKINNGDMNRFLKNYLKSLPRIE